MKRYISGAIMMLLFNSCSGREAVAYIESAQIALSGNRAPVFSKIDRVVTPGEYTIHMNGFSITTPLTKSSDFGSQIEDQRWDVIRSNENSEIDFHLTGNHFHYSIYVKFSEGKYAGIAKDVDLHDIESLERGFRKYHNYWKVRLVKFGKENYDCMVYSGIEKNSVSKSPWQNYMCHKYNSDKTRYKRVWIRTSFYTYTKGNPHIPSEYNFDDLINRTKPILDSLYIEDF